MNIRVNILDKNENVFKEIDALFDTGAHTCAIDTQVFINLGYTLKESVKSYISTATQTRENVNRVVIDKIKLDDTELNSVLFNTFEFPNTSYPVIIGMNVIRHFKVLMDFKEELIEMYENYTETDDNYYNVNIFGDWRVDNQ